jgi:hypothetical protein
MKTMKSIQFFALALVALTVASCSTDDVIDNSDSGKKADVTISLIGEQTRATGAGDVNTGTDAKVKDFIAFAFDSDGKHLMTTSATSSSLTATFTDLSTTATSVYVVANTAATKDALGIFEPVNSLATLQAVAGDLGATTSTQTKDNLYMHGSDPIVYTGANGAATVTLAFSAAKIELTVEDNRETKDTYTYSDHKVSVLHAGAHANFFAADPSVQTTFYTGLDSYANPVAATPKSYLNDDATNLATPTNKFHYYVFGNNTDGYADAAKSPTIITVSSLRTTVAGGAETRVFYPVHFTSTEQVTGTKLGAIESGNSYAITVTLNDNGSGVIDPEQPVAKADITVTVETTPWNPITAGKDF